MQIIILSLFNFCSIYHHLEFMLCFIIIFSLHKQIEKSLL